jgi:C4-dicarboxylate transporter, DctM subunit
LFRGALWFVATDLATLQMPIAFPMIALWLPSMPG